VNKCLLICFSVFSTAAAAADLPYPPAPHDNTPVASNVDWTGAYFGATAGYAFNNDHSFSNYDTVPIPGIGGITSGAAPAFVRNRTDGFTGGGEIGINWQLPNTSYVGGLGGVVLGFEADAMYVGPGKGTTFLGPIGGDASMFYSRTEYVGTARARIGYAYGNILVYGTGGYAYGGVDESVVMNGFTGERLNAGSRNAMKSGYAYGGGLAYLLPTTMMSYLGAGALTVKLEYIHYDLGSSTIAATSPISPTVISQVKTQGNLVRLGLDYQMDFNRSRAITAKY